MYDFFISHASVDKDSIVRELVDKLRKKNCSVWYDEDTIKIGDNINHSIESGLKQSHALILIVTEAFLTSKWCHVEFGKFSLTQTNRIIPLIYNISNDNYTSFLQIAGNLKYINVKNLIVEKIVDELTSMIILIKNNNPELMAIERLKIIQKKLNTYENILSNIISLKLIDYFEMLNNREDYLVFSAQKILNCILSDILKYKEISYEKTFNDDNYKLIEFVSEKNLASINIIEYIQFVIRANVNSQERHIKLLINQALGSILEWYISLRYPPLNLKSPKIEVISPEKLSYEDFATMYEIDQLVLRDDLIASIETSFSWYKYNNYTHIAIRDISTQKLIGYFTMLPITEEAYNLILSGNFKDKDFNTDAILQYDFPDFYKLYIAAVAIHPDYQNTTALITLYNALIDLLIALANERNVYISEVIAEASTKQGEKFCKLVGMKKRLSTTSNTDVYTMILIPPEFRLRNENGKILMKLCKQKYEEYRDYFDSNAND